MKTRKKILNLLNEIEKRRTKNSILWKLLFFAKDSTGEIILKLKSRWPIGGVINKKYFFIHTPKVAGTAIKSSFSDCRPSINFKKSKLKRMEKIAFVRNPYDRLVSSYFYLVANSLVTKKDLLLKRYILP